MEKKLFIPLGDKKIVVEIDDMNGPEFAPACCVYIVDKEDCIVQDICLVRPHEDINKQTAEFETNNEFVDCLVWSNPNDEDYTDKFVIGIYEESEEI